MEKRYQVVSAAVMVTVTYVTGPVLTTLYKGNVFTGDPDTDHRVKANLESGYIVELDNDELGGVDANGDAVVTDADGKVLDVPNPTPTTTVVDDSVPAPLPADGTPPPVNASKATWVEYAVKSGRDRAEAEKATKADLIALVKS
jgi:hypothetical protein